MRLTKIAVHTLLAAVILGAWAMAPNSLRQTFAQEAESDEERFRGRFARIDTNGDNVMRRTEYTVYRITTFNSMDSDGDGVLSLPEFRDRGRKPSERRAERRTKTFVRFDQDGSGGVAREEWDGYANRRFERMDSNDDWEVSFAEFVAYVK